MCSVQQLAHLRTTSFHGEGARQIRGSGRWCLRRIQIPTPLWDTMQPNLICC